jgi:hypothetical protein
MGWTQVRACSNFQAAILAHDPSLSAGYARTATATLAAATSHPTGNLPAPLTSFIGRQDQLIEVGRAVRECRLVTLTGPPGVGKTRLAVELGRTVREDFRTVSGWWSWVRLARRRRRDPGLSSALAVAGSQGRPVTATTDALASTTHEAIAVLQLRARRAPLILTTASISSPQLPSWLGRC